MKIVLGIDLFESDLHLDPLIYQELRNWCQDPQSEVLPVFIHPGLVADEKIIPENSNSSDSLKEILSGFAPIKIIKMEKGGRRQEVDALLDFAKEVKAGMIAMVSRGKAGLEKKLLGSFAETALLRSEWPILFLDDEANSRSKENTILFSTDFSDASVLGFKILLKQIQHLQSDIVIFNAIPLPQFAAAGHVYTQALNVLPRQYWEEQRLWAERKGSEFCQLAQQCGISARLEIANQVYSVENAIHEVVRREKARLVAMVSVSNPLHRFLVGSVSRAILRTRIKPIWICGPQALDNLGASAKVIK